MRHFLTITVMFMCVGASAQFTDFASITMDERNLKSCSLDPEARAVDKSLFTVGEYGQVQDFSNRW